MPFFSIITSTYNVAETLPRLLDSLAAQTCRDFNWIVQDGASTDETMCIVERYRPFLPEILAESRKDTGIYDAWNRALDRAGDQLGDWVLFLGGDDYLYKPDVLYKVKETITAFIHDDNKYKILNFVAGGVAIVSSKQVPLRYISGRSIGSSLLLQKASIPTPFPGLFISRILFKTQKFDSSFRIAGDYDFLCRTWHDDARSMHLPFLVSAMNDDGISSQRSFAVQCTKETIDAADRYFSHSWSFSHRMHYFRIYVLGFIYTIFPSHAFYIHNIVRKLFGKQPLLDRKRDLPTFSPEGVPIFIISFNRLSYLKKLIAWFEKMELCNITIVDNHSTYQPLLDYLDSLPYRVEYLEKNYGHLAVWTCGKFATTLEQEYFIVTDPDVLPVEDCPDDAILQFYNRLMDYPSITKCGFSLLLDDIPSNYPLRQSVIDVEKPYWENSLPDGSGYFAPIDTTFALYRPGITPQEPKWFDAIRLTPPYTARHLPWYESSGANEECIFYKKSCNTQSSFWTATDTDSLKQENLALRRRIEELESQVDMLSQHFGNKIFIVVYRVLRSIKRKIIS